MAYLTIHHALRAWGAWKSFDDRVSIGKYHSAKVFSAPDWDAHRKKCPSCCQRPDIQPDCGRCNGRGWILARVPLIDPKIIPGKSAMKTEDYVPDEYRIIDRVVAGFESRKRAVVMARYVYVPRARKTACILYVNRMCCESGIPALSRRTYEYLLTRARIELSLATGIPQNHLTNATA